MNIILSFLILGISLSMDAFSLSIFLGTMINKKNGIILIILIGIFHFFMPILGAVVGFKISNVLSINGDLIFGIILLFLAMQIFMNLYKKEDIDKNFTIYELVLLSFGVAVDSFSIGFGLSFNDNFMIVASVIFSLCSMIFTYLGLVIGKYANDLFGIYSKTLGGILLLIFSLIHLI